MCSSQEPQMRGEIKTPHNWDGCHAGDFADLDQLVRLKQRFGFLLVVDDAHGTLVCGPG